MAADSTHAFKTNLDKEWLQQEFLYNWKAAEPSSQILKTAHRSHKGALQG
jgi:hypothetical protein